MNLNWKNIFIGFLIGLLVGGGIGRFMSPWFFMKKRTPEEMDKRILMKFSRKLDLTSEQKEKIGLILKEKRSKMDVLLTEFRPRFDAVRSETADEIRQQLDQKQLKKFEEIHKKFEERLKNRRPPIPF